MLSCIRCNQILNKGEKFCHLCGGLGAVSQNVRQMPEQKRDSAPRAQDEQSIVTYWPWLALFSLVSYLAALAMSYSLVISSRIGLIGPRFTSSVRGHAHVSADQLTLGGVALVVFFMLLSLALYYIATCITDSEKLKNAGPSQRDFGMAGILAAFIMAPIAFFISSFLGIHSQTTNHSIVLSAIIAIGVTVIWQTAQRPKDDFNN